MNRRSTPQKKLDEAAFPVRIRIVVPPRGLGRALDLMHLWLRENVGSGNYGAHSAPGLGCDALAIYLRSIGEAQRFLEAFPQLELADGIRARS